MGTVHLTFTSFLCSQIQENDSAPQSDSQKMYVRQKYPERVFQVIQTTAVSQPMDMALQCGTLVGVIKEGDPMGNKDRWFVDNGGKFTDKLLGNMEYSICNQII